LGTGGFSLTGGTGGTGGTSTSGSGGRNADASSGGGPGGNLGQGGAMDGGALDVPAPTDASQVACGNKVCAATQICVYPGCGGGTRPLCLPLGDAAACPPNYTYYSNCPLAPLSVLTGPGCDPPPCVPPSPYCLDIPAACAGQPSCACLPASVCAVDGGTGQCTPYSGPMSSVRCMSA
jgi:hypothetical protein